MSIKFEKLYFPAELVPPIKTGSKTTAWRLFGTGHNIEEGQTVKLMNRQNQICFAKAEITDIIDKRLGDLTPEDRYGHEIYGSPLNMYQVFSKHYRRRVGPSTSIRIIHFKVDQVAEKLVEV